MRAMINFIALTLVCAIPAQGQITEEILQAKESVPGLDSRLTEIAHQPAAAKIATALPFGVEVGPSGRTIVVIEPPQGRLSADIDVVGLRALGAEVLSESRHLLRVAIPPERLVEATPGVLGPTATVLLPEQHQPAGGGIQSGDLEAAGSAGAGLDC